MTCTCQHACQKCLLGFDTRFEADRLDRNAALAWINPTWLTQLSVPKESRIFGSSTVAETAPILEAVERELARGVHDEIAVYLQGEPDIWELSSPSSAANHASV